MFAGLDQRPTSSRFAPLDVVLINSSTPALIGPYRQRHHTPFPLYSDRHRKLYKALGMTRKTWDMGKDADKGSYIVKSQLQNVTSSISVRVVRIALAHDERPAADLISSGTGWCQAAEIPGESNATRRRVCL